MTFTKKRTPHGSLGTSAIHGKNISQGTPEKERSRERLINRLSNSLSCCQSDVTVAGLFLTFLLPSVTVRGTGMGGHLLRLGGGFSLFHRMMI